MKRKKKKELLDILRDTFGDKEGIKFNSFFRNYIDLNYFELKIRFSGRHGKYLSQGAHIGFVIDALPGNDDTTELRLSQNITGTDELIERIHWFCIQEAVDQFKKTSWWDDQYHLSKEAGEIVVSRKIGPGMVRELIFRNEKYHIETEVQGGEYQGAAAAPSFEEIRKSKDVKKQVGYHGEQGLSWLVKLYLTRITMEMTGPFASFCHGLAKEKGEGFITRLSLWGEGTLLIDLEGGGKLYIAPSLENRYYSITGEWIKGKGTIKDRDVSLLPSKIPEFLKELEGIMISDRDIPDWPGWKRSVNVCKLDGWINHTKWINDSVNLGAFYIITYPGKPDDIEISTGPWRGGVAVMKGSCLDKTRKGVDKLFQTLTETLRSIGYQGETYYTVTDNPQGDVIIGVERKGEKEIFTLTLLSSGEIDLVMKDSNLILKITETNLDQAYKAYYDELKNRI